MKLSLRARFWLLMILYFPVMTFLTGLDLKEQNGPYFALIAFFIFGLLFLLLKCPHCKSRVFQKPIKYKNHSINFTYPWVPKNCWTCGERL